MGHTLHLFRRGDTYQWRRRLSSPSTISCVLQVSLRTTDLRRARILARRLTAESDRMLDDIREETLTPAEASAWLRHVVAKEMARVRKSRDTIFANGGADTRADWAMATAWRMLAQRSVNVELADEDIEDLRRQGRSGICYTTIKDEWNVKKIELLVSLGYEVKVIEEIEDGVRTYASGSDIRLWARNCSDMWREAVPKGCADQIEAWRRNDPGRVASFFGIPQLDLSAET